MISIRYLQGKLQNKERFECNINAPDLESEKHVIVQEADAHTAAVWDDQCDWSTPPDSRLAAEGMNVEGVTQVDQSKTSAAYVELPRTHMSRTLRIPSWLKSQDIILDAQWQFAAYHSTY